MPADLPVPDPATRHLLAEAFEAGYFHGVAPHADPDFDAWYATTTVPPPLPDEPPDGAICHGTEGDLWQRRDDWAGNRNHWFRGGHGFQYASALDAGLDPRRRLVELPTETALDALAAVISEATDAMYTEAMCAARDVVRALAERGPQ